LYRLLTAALLKRYSLNTQRLRRMHLTKLLKNIAIPRYLFFHTQILRCHMWRS